MATVAPTVAGDRIAACIAGELRDHVGMVHDPLLEMMRSWPLPVHVFIDTWSMQMAVSNSTPWLLARTKNNPVVAAVAGVSVNASWTFWSSLYDTNRTDLVSLNVEDPPANKSYLLHGLAVPQWLLRAGVEKIHGFSGTLPNLWKMHNCAAAISQRESDLGRQYVVVVKLRPDFHFFPPAIPGVDWAVRRFVASAQNATCVGARCDQLLVADLKSDPSSQVSDKYAVGTSAAMRYYLSAWDHAEALWSHAEHQTRVNDHMLSDEHLMFAHMRRASFAYSTIGTVYQHEHPAVVQHPKRSSPKPAPHHPPPHGQTPAPHHPPPHHHTAVPVPHHPTPAPAHRHVPPVPLYKTPATAPSSRSSHTRVG